MSKVFAGRAAPALAVLLLSLGACRGPREATEAAVPAAVAARVAAIRARAADRGDFDVSVGARSLARGVITGRLAAGDAVAEGQLYDAFVTELRAGAALTADVRSEAFGPVLAVLAPSGETTFGENPDGQAGHAHVALEAPEAGLYMLLVMPAEEDAAGVYQLDVTTPGPVVAYPPELLR